MSFPLEYSYVRYQEDPWVGVDISDYIAKTLEERRKISKDSGEITGDYKLFGQGLEWIENEQDGLMFAFGYEKKGCQDNMSPILKEVTYWCPECEGWVKGQAIVRELNTISDEHPLSGTRGYTCHCRVCYQEIGSCT